jgi:hypothetical protein
MTRQHTPGPWAWGYTTRNLGTGAMEGDLILTTQMANPPLNDRVVFAVREDWRRHLADSADAALIAAAPEMLDILRDLLNNAIIEPGRAAKVRAIIARIEETA